MGRRIRCHDIDDGGAHSMSASEDELLQRIKGGDPVALTEYLELRRPDLIRFIERNLGESLRRKVSADDVFQDVSFSCMNSQDRVDLSERDPFSWFCRLAERRIIDSHRSHFKTKKRDANREVVLGTAVANNSAQLANLLVSSITSPSQVLSREEQHQKLATAVASLSMDEQQALELRYLENLPSKQIAKRLGKGDGAIRMLLSRAIKRLEQVMAEP